MFRKSIHALAVAALVAATPIAASAQATGETLLPSQTVLTGTLEQQINSKSASVGDPFVLDVQAPYPGDDQRYAGARIYGHVAAVTHASLSRKGVVQLATDRLTLADGTTASLNSQVLSIDAQGNKSNSTVKTIAGAVIGQVVGNYIGKHIGTDVGGAIGAIGGAIYAANTGQNIALNQGSQVSVKTTQPATVLSRRQANYPTPYPTPYH
jgi:outer membrane lipoprotein SlyB